MPYPITTHTSIGTGVLHLLVFFFLAPPCMSEKLEAALLTHNAYKPDKNPKPPKNSGDEFFVQLLDSSDLLVDKTLFVKDIIEHPSKLFLITTPRRWGKSVNLDMLKVFLHHHIHDYEGELKLPIASTDNYRLFVNGEVVFDPEKNSKRIKGPTLVAKHKSIISQHLGKYPVILTHLFADGNTTASYHLSLQIHIQVAFEEHKYVLVKYKRLMDKPKGYFEEQKIEARKLYLKYCRYWFFQEPMNITELLESYTFLSEMLYLHFNKKPWLLMDAYHSPFEELCLYNELPPEEQKTFFEFFAQFLKAAFVDNPFLEKGVVVGLYPPTEELYQTVFTNATICDPMTGTFMEHFSFRQNEMQALYKFLKIPTTTQQEIDHWYKGYKMNNRDFDIYNAVAIVRYLKKRRFDKYWINTGGLYQFMRSFLKLPAFEEKLLSLVNGSDIVVSLDRERFTWDDYDVLIGAERTVITPSEDFIDKAFMHLYNLGYLTLSENYDINSKTYKYRMRVPNNEIRGDMKYNYENLWTGTPLTGGIFRFRSSEAEYYE